MAVLDIAVAALAMVLVVSGVLKIRDPEATVPMLAAIRLPATRPAVLVVAASEIVVGATTLVIGGRLPTSALALLYAAFAVVGVVLLRSGAAVPCGCFGQRSAEMTSLHVGVNAVAALVGAAAAVVGATGLFTTAADLEPLVVVVATVAAVLLASVVVALLTVVPTRIAAGRAPRALALASDRTASRAIEPGAAGPARLVGQTPAGAPVEVEVAGTGRVTLLVFLTTGCTTCLRFWDAFSAPGGVALPGERTDLVVVTHGPDREDLARVRALAPVSAHGPAVVCSTRAWRDYAVPAGPYVVLLDGQRDLVLGEGAATSWPDTVALVRQAVHAVGMAE